MAQISDEELLDWIDEFVEEELRQVLKYLILLNADAVQKAMSYVRRGRRNRSGESSVMSASSGHVSLPSPKQTQSHHQRTRSEGSNDIAMDTVVVVKHQEQVIPKAAIISEVSSPQKSQEAPLRAPPHPSTEPISSKRNKKSKSLLVLCTSKPSSSKQGEDQDKAMIVCKKAGIIPYIVLQESRPREALELIQQSKVAEFPQFFLRDDTASTTFLGVYDTVHQMYVQGLFTTELLKSTPSKLTVLSSPPPPPPPNESDQAPAHDTPSSSSNQRLDTLLQHNYDESSDEEEVSTSKESTPTGHVDQINPPNKETEEDLGRRDQLGISDAATGELDKVSRERSLARGDHLEGMNQPKDFDDAKSIDSAELFDPPTPPPPEKPILAAAQKAAEQIKKEADLAKGVPIFLAGLNQPNVNVDDDARSLDDDPGQLFDPPKPPPSQKPLLDAAKKAAAQTQQQQVTEPVKSPPQDPSIVPTSQPSPTKVGFSQETITLKPVGARRPSGQLGEKDTSGSQPPPSPSTVKIKSQTSEKPLPSTSVVSTLPLVDEQKNIEPPPRPPPAVVPIASPSSNEPAWMKILAEQEQGEQNQTEPLTKEAASVPQPTPPPNQFSLVQPQPTTTDIPSTSNASATASLSSSLSQPNSTLPVEPSPPTTSTNPQPSSSLSFAAAAESLPTSPKKSLEAQRGVERKKSSERKYPDGGACYLVYDAVGGELNIYYSEIPIVGAVGVWTSPDILAFKEAQGLGKSELIGNCASGVQDRQQYYNGWCQFVRAAKSMDATVTILDVGVPVDFYLYMNGDTRRVQSGSFETDLVDAVACVPRNADFPSDLRGKKWSKAAKKIGAVALFRSLSARDGGGGESTTNTNSTSTMVPVGSFSQLEVSTTIPEEEEVSDIVIADTKEAVTPTIADVVVPTVRPPLEPEPLQNAIPPALEPEPLQNTIPPPLEPEPFQNAIPPPLEPEPVQKVNAVASSTTKAETVEAYPSAVAAPNPPGGACYLVYEPDSSGRLVEHYSKTPIEDAIGRWAPAGSKSIAGFKFKQNLGKNVLIGNCSAGVQGRRNYSSGWCQFVRSARVMEAEVMIWDPVAKGLMVDVYLYQDDNRPTHQTVKLLPGVSQSVAKTLAVACIPKNTPFYEGMGVDILKWLADGSNYGASSRF